MEAIRVIINESTNFSNYMLDKVYGVNRFDKKISNTKIFIASMNKISAETFTVFQLFATFLLITRILLDDTYFLISVIGSGLIATFMVYFFSERNKYYDKNYYTKKNRTFPIISMIYFVFLCLIPIFMVYLKYV